MPAYKYHELKQELVRHIRTGHYRRGDMLESEAVLQRRFNLSRNTVRQALAELENEGFVSRHRGKGTIVSDIGPGGSKKVALVLYNISLMLHPVTAGLIRGINEALALENYTLDILAGDRDLCGERFSSLLQTYAGLLVGAAEMDEALLQKFLNSPIPCIFLKNYRQDYRDRVWKIDFAAAGRMATEHLIGRGADDLGVIYSGARLGITQDFLEGVRSACLENGVKLRAVNCLCTDELSSEELHGKILTILRAEPRPRGIVCFADSFARQVLDCAGELGIEVPRELAVTGCNDTDASRYSPIPLTSLQIPTRELGISGAGELLRRIRGDAAGTPVLLQPKLVVRDSSEARQ
ncbi:MAG: LacI family DNA-binding transcriptional regulator [Lentisphaeria bacterium]|nr:LacI family DNA-binding transcriptional regulator [Lentisphaeria bacterium]